MAEEEEAMLYSDEGAVDGAEGNRSVDGVRT